MTVTSSPQPDRTRCPVCRSVLDADVCGTCGADLGGATGVELWEVDTELYRLGRRRTVLIDQLGAARVHPPVDLRPPPPAPGWPPFVAAPDGSGMAPYPTHAAPPPSAVGAASHAAGPQLSSILLGLGVTLLVIAATIFAAVTWNRLGAVGQGVLLVALTAVAAGATRLAAQRRLTGTAEALGVLTVLMGPLVAQAVRITVDLPAVDDRVWSNWPAWSWWPVALLIIGVMALAFSRWVGIGSSSYIGAVLVQVALPFWVVLAPVGPVWAAVLLVLQATVLAVGPAFSDRSSGRRTIWGIGTVMAWTIGAGAALGAALDAAPGTAAHLFSVGALGATAIGAAVMSRRWYRHMGVGPWATAGCALTALATLARAIGGIVPDVAWWPLVGAAAVGALMAATQLDGPHRTAARAASWVIAGVAAIPVLVAGVVAAATMSSLDASWRAEAGASVELMATDGLVSPLWASALAGILALGAAAVVDLGMRSRRELAATLTASAVALVVVVPPLLELPLGAVVAMALSAAAVLAALAWRSGTPRGECTAAGAALAVAGLWSVGPVSLELVALASAAGFGALLVALGLRAEDGALAGVGAALAATAVVAESARVADALGADLAWSVATAAIVAALASVAMALAAPVRAAIAARPPVDRRPPPPGSAAPMPGGPTASATPAAWVAVLAGSTVLLGAHLVSLVAMTPVADGGPIAPLTAALVIGAVSAGAVGGTLRAKSPAWMSWTALSGLEVLVLIWLRLADANVVVPEAYTLPLAAILAAGGWTLCRARRGGWRNAASWHLEGPALAMAVGPTVLLALGDPGVARQVIGLGLGALLLAAGVGWRRRAPVDVGVAALVVLAIQGVAPYAAEVPRWISFGLVGALLVALGATFEQRRRDLRQARHRYAGLR